LEEKMQTFSLSYLILSLLVFSFFKVFAKFLAAKKSPLTLESGGSGENETFVFSVIAIYAEKTAIPSSKK